MICPPLRAVLFKPGAGWRALFVFASLAIVLPLFFPACAPVKVPPKKPAAPMLSRVEALPDFADDLDRESLLAAVDTSLRYFEKNGAPTCFNGRCFTADQMRQALSTFRGIVASDADVDTKRQRILASFDIYRSPGSNGRGRVVFTGYYEPILNGSLTRTERFRYPLYRAPADTITVRLGFFRERFGSETLVGRIKGRDLVPYYTRQEIDEGSALAKRGLELAWVDDPVALFILHIQGSGQIRLPDGKLLRVNFAQKNGHPFRGLTLMMHEKGYIVDKSYRSMKAYLQSHPENRQELMNYNESYVFFRAVSEGPLGALGYPVVGGRSIASDWDLFPRGTLAWVKLRKPVFDDAGELTTWQPFGRFVLNHDVGGAIKGPGRVDLFCGTGPEAERVAGSFSEAGELYILVPKRAAGES